MVEKYNDTHLGEPDFGLREWVRISPLGGHSFTCPSGTPDSEFPFWQRLEEYRQAGRVTFHDGPMTSPETWRIWAMEKHKNAKSST